MQWHNINETQWAPFTKATHFSMDEGRVPADRQNCRLGWYLLFALSSRFSFHPPLCPALCHRRMPCVNYNEGAPHLWWPLMFDQRECSQEIGEWVPFSPSLKGHCRLAASLDQMPCQMSSQGAQSTQPSLHLYPSNCPSSYPSGSKGGKGCPMFLILATSTTTPHRNG